MARGRCSFSTWSAMLPACSSTMGGRNEGHCQEGMSDHQVSVQVQSTRYKNRYRILLKAVQHMSFLAHSCFSTHVPKLHNALYRQAPTHICMSDRLYVCGQTDPNPFTNYPPAPDCARRLLWTIGWRHAAAASHTRDHHSQPSRTGMSAATAPESGWLHFLIMQAAPYAQE